MQLYEHLILRKVLHKKSIQFIILLDDFSLALASVITFKYKSEYSCSPLYHCTHYICKCPYKTYNLWAKPQDGYLSDFLITFQYTLKLKFTRIIQL